MRIETDAFNEKSDATYKNDLSRILVYPALDYIHNKFCCTLKPLYSNFTDHFGGSSFFISLTNLEGIIVIVSQKKKKKKKKKKQEYSRLHKAPAKRSQHANATYRNIVGRNILRAFGHRVATCCNVLGVVGSNLTIFKAEPTTPSISQHIATRWPNARYIALASFVLFCFVLFCFFVL